MIAFAKKCWACLTKDREAKDRGSFICPDTESKFSYLPGPCGDLKMLSAIHPLMQDCLFLSFPTLSGAADKEYSPGSVGNFLQDCKVNPNQLPGLKRIMQAPPLLQNRRDQLLDISSSPQMQGSNCHSDSLFLCSKTSCWCLMA